ncbi:tigger transposable element-derived protein 6-like [Ornithodoros turicata]|uniref:tigger transposable element-derived protein 6-like n=1 Tax=Ornithodoros turicata TaxID=34597 RepID=UPI0031394F40
MAGKQSKDRPTVLCLTNMDRTDKRKLVVIESPKICGVSKASSCCLWISVPMKRRGLQRSSSSSGSSLSAGTWLRQGRRVLLLLEDCSAHKVATPLRSVTLLFLPPNTTSVMQPLDLGIIWSLKSQYYRKRLVSRFVFDMDQQRAPTPVAKAGPSGEQDLPASSPDDADLSDPTEIVQTVNRSISEQDIGVSPLRHP